MGLQEIARLPDRVGPTFPAFFLRFFLPLCLKSFGVSNIFPDHIQNHQGDVSMSTISFMPRTIVQHIRSHSHGGKGEFGMSMIELIVVVAIIAIMTAIAIPNLMPKRFEVRTAAFNLRSNLMQARTAAVKTNSDAIVTLDSSNNSYNATCAGNTLFAVVLSNDVGLTTGNTSITFKPLGTASSSTLMLVGSSGNCTVKVKGSGRVFIDGDCPN